MASHMEKSNLVKTAEDQKILLLSTVSKKAVEMTQEFPELNVLDYNISKTDRKMSFSTGYKQEVKPHKKFKAEVYVLKKEEGGRHTPFFKGYRPQFYFRTTDVTGSCELPEGTEMVMPGDNVNLDIELITPIAMDKELRFAIREGGHTVGAGVVTEIIE